VGESTRGRRAWRQAAAQIEQYRRTYQVTDPNLALGPESHDPKRRADRQRIALPLSGSRPSSGPPTAAATPSRSASVPASPDLVSRVAGRALCGPPRGSGQTIT